jgi:hypothetical protein
MGGSRKKWRDIRLMKYNVGQTVYTVSIIDNITEYTIIGKIEYKILGFTYKTRYVCKPTPNNIFLFDKSEKVISGRKLHKMITDNKE